MCKINLFKTAVILAGGKSSRMGFDKQLIKKESIYLTQYLIDCLNTEFEEVILISNKKDIYKNFKNVKIFEDINKNIGPLEGFRIGLRESIGEYVFFWACDMPNLNLDLIKNMKELILKNKAQACFFKINETIQPFCSFVRKDAYELIENRINTQKRDLKSFFELLNYVYIKENNSADFFENLNTQNDLKNWENRKVGEKPDLIIKILEYKSGNNERSIWKKN